MGPQMRERHAEGWQRNCRSFCCWQRKTGFIQILYTGNKCHILCVLSSRLLSNMHWRCLNCNTIPNKVVSCVNTAMEKHPERLRQAWILSEASMSYLLPGCQHDAAMLLRSGGCRGGDGACFCFLATRSGLLQGGIRRGAVLYLPPTSGWWNTELWKSLHTQSRGASRWLKQCCVNTPSRHLVYYDANLSEEHLSLSQKATLALGLFSLESSIGFPE